MPSLKVLAVGRKPANGRGVGRPFRGLAARNPARIEAESAADTAFGNAL